MKELTPDEKKRLWKKYTKPIRKILLWGKDSEKNNCLLILYGRQEFEKEIKSSPRSYYVDAYLLSPTVTYTHYAVFHGMNGHLPSIPNVRYCDEQEKTILCYTKGYQTAKITWDYNRETRCYDRHMTFDDKYIIKEFYNMDTELTIDYYAENRYEDYVEHIKSKGITFEDFELIEHPSELFGFGEDSPYYENIIHMFSKQRLYSRIKNMKELISKNPSAEDYEKIFDVASVELACGIFQELMIAKNPILLQKAQQIAKSKILWAKKEYHNGLKRFAQNYINVFDEELMKQQKEWIYQTLPEMDFHVKRLKIYGEVLTGEKLEEYLQNCYGVYNNYWTMQYGTQKLYDKTNYNDGKNVNNVAFKNTIQTAAAYDMADVIGKIAYYLDAERTKCYFMGSGKTKAYHYYQRYIRRAWDKYKAESESKFVQASREFLASWQYEDTIYSSFFMYRYFQQSNENDELWCRHIDDIIYIVKNTGSWNIFGFCYKILQKAQKQNLLPKFDVKELITLSQIPYDYISKFFEKLLLPKLKALTTFDADIMLTLMNSKSETLQKAANTYFIKTNGKFQPQDIVDMLCLDTIDKWYRVVKKNISTFNAEEYIAFTQALTEKSEYFVEKQIAFSEEMIELIQNSTKQLDSATMVQKQRLLHQFLQLILNNAKMPEFIAEMTENIIFYMPYEDLKEALQTIELKHGVLSERNRNTVMLLKCVKDYIFPKDSAIISILETSSSQLVKMLSETLETMKDELEQKSTTLLLLLECNVFSLNQTAKSVFESLELQKREKVHMLLLDSPVERTYQYALQKLDDYYGDKTPKQFVSRMLEHPCVAVKYYLSQKLEKTFTHLESVSPDLYLYYVKTLLYLPNKATKSKDDVCKTIPTFLQYYPEKQKEIEEILLSIGSTNSKINAERALVTFAQIQKEVCSLCK